MSQIRIPGPISGKMIMPDAMYNAKSPYQQMKIAIDRGAAISQQEISEKIARVQSLRAGQPYIMSVKDDGSEGIAGRGAYSELAKAQGLSIDSYLIKRAYEVDVGKGWFREILK